MNTDKEDKEKSMEATLAIVKPDAARRNIVGQIICRAEDQDLSLVGIKLVGD